MMLLYAINNNNGKNDNDNNNNDNNNTKTTKRTYSRTYSLSRQDFSSRFHFVANTALTTVTTRSRQLRPYGNQALHVEFWDCIYWYITTKTALLMQTRVENRKIPWILKLCLYILIFYKENCTIMPNSCWEQENPLNFEIVSTDIYNNENCSIDANSCREQENPLNFGIVSILHAWYITRKTALSCLTHVENRKIPWILRLCLLILYIIYNENCTVYANSCWAQENPFNFEILSTEDILQRKLQYLC